MSDQPRPAYVIFETRAVEDRSATVESGHYTTKDVTFAVVTPAGTKDRIEKEAEQWLRDLEEAVRQERFPGEWLTAYRQKFKAWQENQEDPESGTSVRDWPGLSPSQVRTCLDLGIRTVEQVAEMTEEAIQRIGMGGRALRAKAQAWLDASDSTGKISEELAALREEISSLKQRDSEREEELQLLRKERDTLASAGASKK